MYIGPWEYFQKIPETDQYTLTNCQSQFTLNTPFILEPVDLFHYHCLYLSVSSSYYFHPLTPNYPYRGRIAPLPSKRCMVYTVRFFSSKCSLFQNSNIFGSCIIHILYTGCAKKKIPAPKG